MEFAIFNTDTRRVVARYSLPRVKSAAQHGQEVEPGHYIKLCPAMPVAELYADESGNIHPKTATTFAFDKETISADGVDTAAISGLPAHTLVTWPDGEVTEINDGLLEFAVDLAGSYAFIIDAVQYTKQEVTIEALA